MQIAAATRYSKHQMSKTSEEQRAVATDLSDHRHRRTTRPTVPVLQVGVRGPADEALTRRVAVRVRGPVVDVDRQVVAREPVDRRLRDRGLQVAVGQRHEVDDRAVDVDRAGERGPIVGHPTHQLRRVGVEVDDDQVTRADGGVAVVLDLELDTDVAVEVGDLGDRLDELRPERLGELPEDLGLTERGGHQGTDAQGDGCDLGTLLHGSCLVEVGFGFLRVASRHVPKPLRAAGAR